MHTGRSLHEPPKQAFFAQSAHLALKYLRIEVILGKMTTGHFLQIRFQAFKRATLHRKTKRLVRVVTDLR